MKIHELFVDKSKWTQGAFARNTDRECCSARDEKATCWCLFGAAIKLYDDKEIDRVLDAIRLGIQKRYPNWQSGTFEWNDSVGFEVVKTLVEELQV